MQLVPYLIATFQRYSVDGTPPCRALVLDNPHESRLHTVDDQFMLGDRMMVAPLFAGEPNRKIVLPEGKWHDFWTREASDGVTIAESKQVTVEGCLAEGNGGAGIAQEIWMDSNQGVVTSNNILRDNVVES